MKVAITGASGYLGREFCESLENAGHAVIRLWHRQPPADSRQFHSRVDLLSKRDLGRAMEQTRPDAVIHTAAVSTPDECERFPDLAFRVNAEGTLNIIEAAAGIPVFFTSTDLVFDGSKGRYEEDDVPNPVNLYGKSKLAAEQHVLKDNGCVIRLALPLGRSGSVKRSFIDWLDEKFRRHEEIPLFVDQFRSPIYVPVVCKILGLLLQHGRNINGIFHLGGEERLNRLEMARIYIKYFPGDESLFRPVRISDSTQDRRGSDCSLVSTKIRSVSGLATGTLDEAFAHLAEKTRAVKTQKDQISQNE